MRIVKKIELKILVQILALGSILFAQSPDFQKSRLIRLGPVKDNTQVYTGLDLLILDKFQIIEDDTLAIVFNDGSVSGSGRHIIDVLGKNHAQNISLLIQGIEQEMISGSSGFVYNPVGFGGNWKTLSLKSDMDSLRKKELLGAEMILFDIQDIGIRGTGEYQSLLLLMKLSAATQIPLYILDRPNPLNAISIEGPLSNNPPVPVRYGLTMGELAIMINEEGWLGKKPANLFVIPMKNYQRGMYFDETGLPWKILCKHFRNVETILLY